MSGNTSATGGYLSELSPGQIGEETLANLFQTMVVGITGLDSTLVRPRWQPQPPTQPPPETDWCAVGVTNYRGTDFPGYVQDQELSGTLYRLEQIDLMATFYGPHSYENAAFLRDGIYLWQNYSGLATKGIKLREAGDIGHTPELINSQFISRSDVPLSFMRMLSRHYPVETILSAQADFVTNTGLSCSETIEENH